MKRRAFSLIELLAVIAVLSIVLAMSIPAFNQIGRTQALNNGASSVSDLLAFARQEALAQNRVVEVRFYRRPPDPTRTSDPAANPERFRSFQSVIYDERVLTFRPLTSMVNLPPNIVIMGLAEQPAEKQFSTIIYPVAGTRAIATTSLPDTTIAVPYQALRFKPTGGADLDPNGTTDGDKWFLTIKADNDAIVTGPPARPGRNYVTLMVDPISGRVRTFRP